jgi:hypothetical protein
MAMDGRIRTAIIVSYHHTNSTTITLTFRTIITVIVTVIICSI